LPVFWPSEIRQRLLTSDVVAQAEIDWLKSCAKSQPTGNPPRDRRVPNTQTARRIEQFMERIPAETVRQVTVSDMVTFCGYTDATMFQRV
jgi:hypothetical protein